LRISLTVRSSIDANGHMRYCYIDEKGNQAPTLRLHPGDTLYLRLKNEISISPGTSSATTSAIAVPGNNRSRKHDPCAGGAMSAASTNLHFHGLAVPPVCHQDETLRTSVEPGDPPFEYRLQVPSDQPPGLYWYHPHVHGFSEDQLLGGASGALIVEGIENAVPRIAGLPQRVFVIRDEKMPEASDADKVDPNKPTKQLSINYVPVPYPNYPPAVIKMKPGAREFWRVVNASADTYVDLAMELGGKRQPVGLVALDGIPLRYGEPGAKEYTPGPSHILLPPATRAEFVITGPPEGVSGQLMTSFVYRGADDDTGIPKTGAKTPAVPGVRAGQDDVDAARPLASIVASPSVMQPAAGPSPSIVVEPQRAPLSGVRPARKRTLYFSEKLSDASNPNSATLFFITEDGRTPAVFDANNSEPSITVRQGDVEDWTIENRSRESHTFHIHQLHFIVVGGQGIAWEEPTLRDTVNVPAWDGFRRYPSVTLRMDFRDPRIAGTIPFHCHIIQHLDGGMMGTVRIEPPRESKAPATRVP
jgi:FtsP/CotA-like multicopper oxidase with cupredoxin domain